MIKVPDTLALVTGAAGGIGKATVRRLLQDGMTVIALDCAEPALRELVSEIGSSRLLVCPFDLEAIDQIPEIVRSLVNQHGAITRLVNNAAVWREQPISELGIASWSAVLSVNVTAPFLLIRELSPVMTAAGGGAIVNVVSRNAFRSSTNGAAYDASKGALMSLTRTAAGELAKHRIRVNALCPGVVRTPPNAALLAGDLFGAAYRRLIPLDRFAEPEEMASVISFLLSGDASFVTGAAVVADGGQLACQDNERFMEIPGLLTRAPGQ